MFGLKITIFNKKKGIKVDPVVPVRKEPVDEEYKKWKQEKERKERQEIGQFNRAIIGEYIDETVDEYVKYFKSKVPQPFEVGEEVTYLHYGPHINPFDIGYHGSPSSLEKTFGAPDLGGPFTFPVHKVRISVEKLKDSLRNKCDNWNYTEKITDIEAKKSSR